MVSFKNIYELLNLGALKLSMSYKKHIFHCMVKLFWVEFQIPHKISCPYIERCVLNSLVKNYEALYLRACVFEMVPRPLGEKSLISGLCLFFTNTVNTLRLRQDGNHFPDDIFQCIFLMKMIKFRLRFHWSLFPRVQLTIFQHWFR